MSDDVVMNRNKGDNVVYETRVQNEASHITTHGSVRPRGRTDWFQLRKRATATNGTASTTAASEATVTPMEHLEAKRTYDQLVDVPDAEPRRDKY